MQIIQNSQRGEEKPQSNKQTYVSLADNKEPEHIEKNIIVDDADFELENCLEGEEWMFKTFNRKKRMEEKARQEAEEKQREERMSQLPPSHQKPPQPISKPRSEEPEVKKAHVRNASMADKPSAEENKPRRKKKNSRHRRTESKTFDKEFFQALSNSEL